MLTLLSANLQNPFVRPGRVDMDAVLRRLEAFARLVEAWQADVLLCQEVGRSRDFRVDEWLAARLGLTAHYARANRLFGGEEGVALLSRYLLSGTAVRLLGGGVWQRPALGAVVQAPAGEVLVCTAHLSLRPWRNRRQPAALRAWMAATAGGRPAVIGGDFNAHETAPHVMAMRAGWIDTFRALHPTADGTTHTLRLFGRSRRRRLDYIFLRPGVPKLSVVSCEHVSSPGIPFSDHLAVVAVVA